MKKKNSTRSLKLVNLNELFLKLYEHFKSAPYFTASNITHNNICSFKHVHEVIPYLENLVKTGMLKQVSDCRFSIPTQKLKDEGKIIPFTKPSKNDKVVNFPKHATNPIKEDKAKEEDIFPSTYRDELEEEIKKYSTFVVTTAVMNKKVYKPFLESLKNYAKRNNALILLLPCEDVAGRSKKASPIELDPELKDFRVVFKDLYLNRNLCLCAIKTSAKQINPLTGLERLPVAKDASIIMASPKVFLKHIPNRHYDVPPALMTTGAVTENNYDTDKYMSKRTAYLAENDHMYGAVIVEVENEHIFHFRHVQASKEGALTDLGIEYLPDGEVRELKDTVMVMGDSHVGYHDKELHDKVMELAKSVSTKEIILHDIFHGSSISHHDIGKGIVNAIKVREGRMGLKRECEAVKSYLQTIVEEGFLVTVVKSNHDGHLYRYINEGRYINDPMNYEFSLKLALASVDGQDPLQYAIEHELKYKDDKVRWLAEDSSYNIYGVECSEHGSTGPNGSKGSIQAFEKGIGNCVTAHTHSAAIVRNSFCVGTVGEMDMKYNKGLSSWTRTCCLIYSNGAKQLINFIPNTTGDYSYSLD